MEVGERGALALAPALVLVVLEVVVGSGLEEEAEEVGKVSALRAARGPVGGVEADDDDAAGPSGIGCPLGAKR